MGHRVMGDVAIVCPSPVFNPIRSHHLKMSLKVGLLPTSNGMYAFSYVCYRYNFGTSRHPGRPLPAHRGIHSTLRTHLQSVRRGKPAPSMLAFTNGKRPATRPHFPRVVRSALTLHSGCFPGTGIDMLDGSAFVRHPTMFRTLGGVSGGVLGLSAISRRCIHMLSHPAKRCSVQRVVRKVGTFGKGYVVRAVFLGKDCGKRSVSGASSGFILP